MAAIDVSTGEIKVSANSGSLRANALGSCVAISAYHRARRVGGMAHIMLPGRAPASKPDNSRNRYTEDALTALLESVVASGDDPRQLEVCMAGGANVLRREGDTIGEENAAAALAGLEARRIPLAAASVGGDLRRTMTLHLADGRVTHTVGDSGELPLWSAGLQGEEPGKRGQAK